MTLQARVYRNPSWLTLDVLFVDDTGYSMRAVVRPMEMLVDAHEPDGRALEPSLRLPDDTAQSLFQAMWDQGYRPAQGSSGKAEVDALQRHIEFAEKVATNLLNKVVP